MMAGVEMAVSWNTMGIVVRIIAVHTVLVMALVREMVIAHMDV